MQDHYNWTTITMPWAKSMKPCMPYVVLAMKIIMFSMVKVFFISSLYCTQRPWLRIEILYVKTRNSMTTKLWSNTNVWHYGLPLHDHGCWPQYHGLGIHQFQLTLPKTVGLLETCIVHEHKHWQMPTFIGHGW